MTPEQNEQWKAAVMQAYPAPASEGQEGSFEQWRNHRIAEASLLALMPEARRRGFLRGKVTGSSEHLVSCQFPPWVLEIRDACVFQIRGSWKADFVFRADVALLGMQWRYPTPEARAESCERLLLGFLPEALRPLLKHAETYKLRRGFDGVHQICQLCESDGLYRDPQRWLDIQKKATRGSMRPEPENWPYTVVEIVALIAHHILCQPDVLEHSWILSEMMQLNLKYGPGRVSIPENGIAQAFLTALEAECPPPDWLPGA